MSTKVKMRVKMKAVYEYTKAVIRKRWHSKTRQDKIKDSTNSRIESHVPRLGSLVVCVSTKVSTLVLNLSMSA